MSFEKAFEFIQSFSVFDVAGEFVPKSRRRRRKCTLAVRLSRSG